MGRGHGSTRSITRARYRRCCTGLMFTAGTAGRYIIACLPVGWNRVAEPERLTVYIGYLTRGQIVGGAEVSART